jgi:hypothetical protein
MSAGVKSVSMLSKPQKDWDEFLENRHGAGRGPTIKKLLWVIVPAGILAALILYRYLS